MLLRSINIEILGTIFFALAVLHTFMCGKLLKFSHHYPEHSFRRGFLHLLGEVEVIFGVWAAVFLALFAFWEGPQHVIDYQQSLNFTEPAFVFVIMVISATRPVLNAARELMVFLSLCLQKVLRLSVAVADVWILLVVGPLAGSFITEPAAMTVTALLLRSMFHVAPKKLAYALLAVLFVNVSIGGALTPYAAPPILMVAKTWGWDFAFVFQHFAWKTTLAVVLNATLLSFLFKNSLSGILSLKRISDEQKNHQGLIPWGVTVTHFLFLAGVVITAHYTNVFMGIFLLFLGVTVVTKKYQDILRFRESLLVAFFLAGIIVFGAFQKWWLEPLLSSLSSSGLYFGAVALTAITDNAALTYLGSQVPDLSDLSKYALVAGAITGGGLTVIANAPNAAGYSLLLDKFPGKVMDPLWLFVAAVPPTVIAIICFWILPF